MTDASDVDFDDHAVDLTDVVVEVKNGRVVRAWSTLHKLPIKLTIREYDNEGNYKECVK